MLKYSVLVCVYIVLNAQDSLKVAVNDSIPADSLKATRPLFSVTSYKSDEWQLSFNETNDPIITYTGNAQIIYENLKIKAHQIRINQRTADLDAFPKIDTLKDGQVKITRMPEFIQEGVDPMYGMKMSYNFNTKRARVTQGNTEVKADHAKYEGEQIKKIGQRTILIRDGRFTTCDADSPSFWFHSAYIRLIRDDMLFSGPIILKIHDIPFPIVLPVGVFSLKRGRRSGIKIPKYIQESNRGRGVENFGYYWAASDQFEATLLMNYYEETDFMWYLSSSFRDRYTYNGNFNIRYTPKNLNGQRTDDFFVNFGYNHKYDPSMSISAGGSFASSINVNTFQRDITAQTNQSLRSTFNLSKNWDNGNSLTANASYDHNLLTEAKTVLLPRLSFSMRQKPLFGAPTDPSNKTWYENINFTYRNQFLNQWQLTTALNDSGAYEKVDEDLKLGALHTVSLNAPLSVFKYITMTPSFSYNEQWVPETKELDPDYPDSLVIREKSGFGALRTFNFAVGFNSKLYGFMEPDIFSITSMRWQMTPSINFNYTPDFTTEAYGYTETLPDSVSGGLTRKDGSRYIDRFSGSPFGSTPAGESLGMSIRLGNLFSAKYTDSENKEQKIDYLSVSTGTSINFLKDSLKWSDLSTSFSFPSVKAFSLSGSMTHSLYQLDSKGRARNEFAGIPILKTFSLSTSFSLDSKMFAAQAEKEKKQESAEGEETAEVTDPNFNGQQNFNNADEEAIESLRGLEIPWSANFSVNYTYNKFSIEKENIFGTFNARFSLTKNWKVSYNTSLDLKEFDIKYQNLTVNRDMDCWTFSFVFRPNPYNRSFELSINIKEDMLKDLKYERRSFNRPGF
ncbi:MAG: LPS-assembly protein LptD [Calditrichaeota bacterium]|nr:LPS-assembly protein LptD [Calditrichota bacterium]